MRLVISLLVCLVFLIPDFGFANYYKKGNQICDDFQQAVHYYKTWPDVIIRAGYAIMSCDPLGDEGRWSLSESHQIG